MNETRTEEPTARKLAEARRRGEVAASPALTGAGAVLVLLAVVLWRGPAIVEALAGLLRAALASAALPQPRAGLARLAEPLRELLVQLLPIWIVAAVAVWLAGAAQVGPLLAPAALRFVPARIDPRSRLQRIASAERMLELGYVAAMAVVLLATLAWSFLHALPALATLPAGDHARAASVLASLAADIVLRMGVAAMLLGAIDLVIRRVRARRALRMTRRELSEETRESYGAPEHRARRARMQREVFALSALEDARLLLVDRSGRAIAIGLTQAGNAREPVLLAKAQGELALRMRVQASQSELPVRDHALLVSALFRLEPGAAVPSERHDALAELFVATSAQ